MVYGLKSTYNNIYVVQILDMIVINYFNIIALHLKSHLESFKNNIL